jgi:CHAD domain-containing protein
MAYRFTKNESLAHAIRRVFVEEIDGAVGQLAESKRRVEAVHEARKGIKKIRGLLGLIARPLGPRYKAEDHYFRNAGRRLSKLRDSAVMLQTLDALAAKHQQISTAVLAGIRRDLLRCQRETPPDKQVSPDVLRLLNGARTNAASWPLEDLEFAALLPDLTAAYRGGRKAFRRALKVQSAEALHDFRKQVKLHWYHLRLFDGYLNAELKKRASELRALETCLGDEHNVILLCRRIAADVETARDRQQTRQVVVALEEEATHLRQRALESGLQLYSDRPRDFAAMLSTLSPAIPKRPSTAAPFAKAAVA